MPSKRPRIPEVEVTEDTESGFVVNIYDGEHMIQSNGDRDVLVEGHPEVCFRAFNGEPLKHGEETVPGVHERSSAMTNAEEYGRDDWQHLAEILGAKDRAVQIDDLLDAVVLALTAFADGDEDRRLPSPPPSDAMGLPMQMVYRSETELVE